MAESYNRLQIMQAPPTTSWYAGYLQTEAWKEIRRRVLERDHLLCCGCGRRAVQVHHRSYSGATMRGEDLSELFSVCRSCHRYIEWDGRRRRSPEEKLSVLDRVLMAGGAERLLLEARIGRTRVLLDRLEHKLVGLSKKTARCRGPGR